MNSILVSLKKALTYSVISCSFLCLSSVCFAGIIDSIKFSNEGLLTFREKESTAKQVITWKDLESSRFDKEDKDKISGMIQIPADELSTFLAWMVDVEMIDLPSPISKSVFDDGNKEYQNARKMIGPARPS
jgi:hypothetical protein